MPSSVALTIEQELIKAHQARRFEGIALVAQRDQVIYEGVFGLADRKRSKPHTLATPFPICSITKQFTALLVMQQVAAGKLRLDGVVTDYLPWFSRQHGKIQLRHLLMHTSGLPQLDEIRGFYAQKDSRFAEPEYVVRTVLPPRLNAAPGASFHYNNADYLVLATILQNVTHQPFADLLQNRIVRPLGMNRTGLVSAQHPRAVTGYLWEKNLFVPEPAAIRLENYGAAGAMYSTARDLLLWNRALDTDRLLERKWREVMFTPDIGKGYVALGTWVYSYLPYGGKTPTLYERQGAIGGLQCQNLRVPEDGYSVILLSNVDAAPLEAYSGKGLPNKILAALYSGTKETT